MGPTIKKYKLLEFVFICYLFQNWHGPGYSSKGPNNGKEKTHATFQVEFRVLVCISAGFCFCNFHCFMDAKKI